MVQRHLVRPFLKMLLQMVLTITTHQVTLVVARVVIRAVQANKTIALRGLSIMHRFESLSKNFCNCPIQKTSSDKEVKYFFDLIWYFDVIPFVGLNIFYKITFTSFFFHSEKSGRSITAAPDKIFTQTFFQGIEEG